VYGNWGEVWNVVDIGNLNCNGQSFFKIQLYYTLFWFRNLYGLM
jgi:hypothetical protein